MKSREAINLCVQHANQSEKSCLQPKYSSQQQRFGGSGISRDRNSLKPRVESNFWSLHSYLDQNNETVKKQILLIFYSLQEPLDLI